MLGGEKSDYIQKAREMGFRNKTGGGGQGKKLTSPVHIYIHVGMEETSLILLLYPNI